MVSSQENGEKEKDSFIIFLSSKLKEKAIFKRITRTNENALVEIITSLVIFPNFSQKTKKIRRKSNITL
jgi:hypothetical protein